MGTRRKLLYLTGTRADFGLMARSLTLMDQDPALDVRLAVTGMHLSPLFGGSVADIHATRLRIALEIPVELKDGTLAEGAHAFGVIVSRLTTHLQAERPDALILLGDRSEILAGAVAAIHLNIPIMHLHGGERSGTIDKSIRHAISKLSHYHFTATDAARNRLVAMGENPAHVFVTGAPGLDDIVSATPGHRADVLSRHGLSADRKTALVVFHPVVQSQDIAGEQVATVLTSAVESGLQILAFAPNSDAGSQHIRTRLASFHQHPDIRLLSHVPRSGFIDLLANADVMIGNSSSGIIEAASFGTPVVNVGNRQAGRDRNANTIDVPVTDEPIRAAIAQALAQGRHDRRNIYGDGHSAPRICELARDLPLGPDLLNKMLAY